VKSRSANGTDDVVLVWDMAHRRVPDPAPWWVRHASTPSCYHRLARRAAPLGSSLRRGKATTMDHSAALSGLLARPGFRRQVMSRTRVGHLQLMGALGGRTIDALLDTGAASTVVDLNYCRAEGIATHDTGRLGGGAGGVPLPIHTLGDARLLL